jgi:preprotein translocase subunit SecG
MLVAAVGQYFFGITIFISSLFLILLVLVQRGRGGGLTGALGGPGGQSAFGTKAGDLFTRITVGVAAAWIFLCAAAVFSLRERRLPETGARERGNSAELGNPSAVGESTLTPLPSSGEQAGVEQPSVDMQVTPPVNGPAAGSPDTTGVQAEISEFDTPTTETGAELPAGAAPANETPADEAAEEAPAVDNP